MNVATLKALDELLEAYHQKRIAEGLAALKRSNYELGNAFSQFNYHFEQEKAEASGQPMCTMEEIKSRFYS